MNKKDWREEEKLAEDEKMNKDTIKGVYAPYVDLISVILTEDTKLDE